MTKTDGKSPTTLTTPPSLPKSMIKEENPNFSIPIFQFLFKIVFHIFVHCVLWIFVKIMNATQQINHPPRNVRIIVNVLKSLKCSLDVLKSVLKSLLPV